MKKRNEQNEMRALIKSQLLDAPFKTAFKATLGFYAAQLFITLAFLAVLFLVGVIAYFLF